MSEMQSISFAERQHSSELRSGRHEPPPLSFYQNLTTRHLTKNALERLDATNCDLEYTVDRPPTVPDDLPSAEAFFDDSSEDLLNKVRAFAQHGGPDLSDLMAYRNQWMDPRYRWALPESKSNRVLLSDRTNSTSMGSTRTSMATGPYDVNFEQHMYDHGIYFSRFFNDCPEQCPQPDNIDSVKAAVLRPRPTDLALFNVTQLSNQFMAALEQAITKAQVVKKVVPIIEGPGERLHGASTGITFTNLEHLTSQPIVAAQPDVFYGTPPEKVPPALRDALESMIAPSAADGVPVVPNFFVSVTSPGAEMVAALRQAGYYGALGARGIQSLNSYKHQEPEYDNKAYTLTSVLFRGLLDMHAVHVVAPADPSQTPRYIMTPVSSWNLEKNADDFRQGVSAWRNGREWAQRMREKALNLKARKSLF